MACRGRLRSPDMLREEGKIDGLGLASKPGALLRLRCRSGDSEENRVFAVIPSSVCSVTRYSRCCKQQQALAQIARDDQFHNTFPRRVVLSRKYPATTPRTSIPPKTISPTTADSRKLTTRTDPAIIRRVTPPNLPNHARLGVVGVEVILIPLPRMRYTLKRPCHGGANSFQANA